MYSIYNILINIVFVIAFPYLILKAALGKHGIKERMGRLPLGKTDKLTSNKVIWFHAASVGEVKVLSTIVPQVKRKHPECKLVVSTMTKTGKREAQRILQQVELVFFVPVDLKRFVRRALKRTKPAALILVETEIWLNLIREAKRNGSVVALINGRISENSMRRYLLFKGLFKKALSQFDLLCMQSEEYKDRMIRLGASHDRIQVTGNMKFDRLLLMSESPDTKEMRRQMLIGDNRLVLIGGSTRQGEEEILVGVFKKLKEESRNLIFILAPRHLDRLKQVENILVQHGIGYIRKSQLAAIYLKSHPEADSPLDDHPVILLDTMGELSKLYSIGDVAFVGGSLVPVGGHNLLEPAIHGVPVLFGPHVEHFKEEAGILIDSGGGIRVKNQEELYLNLSQLLADERRRISIGEKAKETIRKRTGVTQKTTDLIFSFLEK
jgi:3-deoxy-D-manno-octulosonic-acid transferase